MKPSYSPLHALLCGVTALLLLAVAPASAQTGGGTIFFSAPWNGAGTSARWTMDSDGSNKTQLPWEFFYASPSTVLHNNFRWFLRSELIPGVVNPDETITYERWPDGTRRSELFAIRSDYSDLDPDNPLTKVKLPIDATLQGGAGWIKGDQMISLRARRWSSAEPGATIVNAGIYTAAIEFDENGSIIGLAAVPYAPAIPFPLGEDGWPEVYYYSWNAQASMVSYVTSSPGLWVADKYGSKTKIYSGDAKHPMWSPDGSVIAFTLGRGISTIKPNGKGRKEIIRGTSQWYFGHPVFNSTGSHIVCVGGNTTSGVLNNDVFRSDVNGSFLTNLTLTPADIEMPLYWR